MFGNLGSFWGNDLDSDAAYTDTEWHHWACTYDIYTQECTIYRDKNQVAQTTTKGYYLGSGTLTISRQP